MIATYPKVRASEYYPASPYMGQLDVTPEFITKWIVVPGVTVAALAVLGRFVFKRRRKRRKR